MKNNFVLEVDLKERWLPIAGYENRYMISSMGRVKRLCFSVIRNKYGGISFSEKIITPKNRGNGYCFVRLRKEASVKSFSIHRLVAVAFIENKEHKPFINHINNIRNDNRVENLEWVTHSQNMLHMYKTGHINQRRKFSDEDVFSIREKYKNGISGYKIAKQMNVSKTNIYDLINGKTYKSQIESD